jgi:hypothetical protein
MYGTLYKSDTFSSALKVHLLCFFICLSFRSGTSLVLSYSFPDAKSNAIGKDFGVTATCIFPSSTPHKSLFVALAARKVVYLYQSRRISL